MISRRTSVVIAFVVTLPLLLEALWELFPTIGMIYLLAHNLYYYPIALWLGEPFFGVDSELGFIVHGPGIVVTAVAYTIVPIGIAGLFTRLRKRQAT